MVLFWFGFQLPKSTKTRLHPCRIRGSRGEGRSRAEGQGRGQEPGAAHREAGRAPQSRCLGVTCVVCSCCLFFWGGIGNTLWVVVVFGFLFFSLFSLFPRKRFFRAELLVNLRRVACTESPAWRYQELLVNLRRVACTESPAWRYQHGDTRAEVLAQSSLHRVTSMEILAQSHQHGDTSMEILAQSHQHGDTCAESPAWSHQHRVTCAEPSAKSHAHRAKCSERSAKSEVQGAKCIELSAQSQVQRAKCIEPGA